MHFIIHKNECSLSSGLFFPMRHTCTAESEMPVVNVYFSGCRIQVKHERDVSNCQLQIQTDEMSSASDTLSVLSCDMKRLHQALSEQSQWWLQVCCSCLCIKHTTVS